MLSALWYFFSVKGVSVNPEGFKPHVALVAILEVLAMLLVACLLGYAIAWWMRGEIIANQAQKIDGLYHENYLLVVSKEDLKKQVELWREKHQHDLSATQQKSLDLTMEKERLQKQVRELESMRMESKEAKSQAQEKLKQAENEIGTLKYRLRQLEFQVREAEETSLKFKNEIAELITRKEKASISDHPFVRPIEPEEKDDLTKIRGIGPFIEKRLNMIGIYTFQHLSELSPEMVDRVGAAIEFFPHRIIKDDWVGQARGFREG